MIDKETYLKEREPVVDKCKNCERVVEGPEPFFPRYAVKKRYCRSYLYPKKKWERGNCNFNYIVIDGSSSSKRIIANSSKRRKAKGFV